MLGTFPYSFYKICTWMVVILWTSHKLCGSLRTTTTRLTSMGLARIPPRWVNLSLSEMRGGLEILRRRIRSCILRRNWKWQAASKWEVTLQRLRSSNLRWLVLKAWEPPLNTAAPDKGFFWPTVPRASSMTSAIDMNLWPTCKLFLLTQTVPCRRDD